MRKRIAIIFIILTTSIVGAAGSVAVAQAARVKAQAAIRRAEIGTQNVDAQTRREQEQRARERAQRQAERDAERERINEERGRRAGKTWGEDEQANQKAAEVRLKMERGGRLVINNWSGEITVTGIDGDTLEAKATDDDGTLAPLDSRVSGSIIYLGGRGGRPFHKNGSADIQVRVPRYVAAVEIDVLSGSITVSNLDGSVKANATSGEVAIECIKGGVNATSASGTLTLSNISGDVVAETLSGSVEYSGDIRPDGNYRMKTASGEVEMQVQGDAPGFTATLTTFSGEIETVFPLKIEKSSQYGGTNRQIIGRYGNGGANLSLNSFSGAVRIVKATQVKKKCN